MEKAVFALDALDSQQFEGYTSDWRWNGWVCPAFTHAQAMQIVAAWHAQDRQADYDRATDTFRFGPLDNSAPAAIDLADAAVAEHYSAVTVDGHTLYPIGAGGWTWDETPAHELQPAQPGDTNPKHPRPRHPRN